MALFSALLRAFLCSLLTISLALAQPEQRRVKRRGKRSGGNGTLLLPVAQASMAGFGGHVVRFGNLSGDAQPEVVTVRNGKGGIALVTAFTLANEVLWQWQRPSRKSKVRASSDVPIQVGDWSGDAFDEVIFVAQGRLFILDGATGEEIDSVTIDLDVGDAVFLFPSLVGGKIDHILVKDRFSRIICYNKNLEIKWERRLRTGHFPTMLDLDKDGEHELLVGYTLLNADGETIWEKSELPRHADSHDFGDLDGDGYDEIAIAPSGDLVVVNAKGETLFKVRNGDTQHVAIGNFDWSSPELEIMALVRGPRSKGHSFLECRNHKGKLLSRRRLSRRTVILSGLDGWREKADESLALLYRTRKGLPVLTDCRGNFLQRLGVRVGSKRAKFSDRIIPPFVFAQHFDFLGDAREEVIAHSEKHLWVYTPQEATGPIEARDHTLPNSRIFNASFYVGVQ